MVLKKQGYEKYYFHCHKTAIYLTMGYSLEMPHVIEPKDTTGTSPYLRILPSVFESA